MTHYKSNLRDIEFNLFEANKLQDMLGAEPFEDFDRDTVMDIVRKQAGDTLSPEADKLAQELHRRIVNSLACSPTWSWADVPVGTSTS